MSVADAQVTFNKSAAYALLAVAAFTVITTIVNVFQSRKLDAIEKRIEALEGRTQEVITERNKEGHEAVQAERELNDCRIDLHTCQDHSKRQEEIVDVCVDKAIQRLQEPLVPMRQRSSPAPGDRRVTAP